MRRDNDIKAPDGFLLGGLRRVRADGTILCQRTDRSDAKPGYRIAANKAWSARHQQPSPKQAKED